jgi:hypothetical protein
MRPFAPNLRRFADPEGEFLTYSQVRASLHPVPAEQHVVVPRDVRIVDAERAAVLRTEARQGL